ncbi:MAG: molybdate ABC transporter substrate-binding protein [Actinomycetota bacterium]|nr:molybdate ABC transporter substrate-binding protein [Actinomycetota bacterium]
MRACYVALASLLLVLAACGGDDSGSSGDAERRLVVFAAASLTDAFEEIADEFETREGAVAVEFNFLASSDLAAQIIEGAPADVFASADEVNADKVVAEGLASDAAIFALNLLSIAVPAGNPQGITELDDLANPDLVVALCNEECPAGRYARELFEGAGLIIEPGPVEADVRAVLTRVALGEADAGIVYVTDIEAEPDVEGVDVPESDNVTAAYAITTLDDAPESATDFVTYVRSEEGRRILSGHGFELP